MQMQISSAPLSKLTSSLLRPANANIKLLTAPQARYRTCHPGAQPHPADLSSLDRRASLASFTTTTISISTPTAVFESIFTGPPGVTASFTTTTIFNIDAELKTCTQLTELKSHTWHRNTGAIGIALCCACGALPHNGRDTDFGKFPPTPRQIDAAGKLVAKLAQGLNIPIDRGNVLTHCEAALIDGYGPYSGDAETRWDLWYLRDSPGDGAMKPGGQIIRGKALWYAKSSPLV